MTFDLKDGRANGTVLAFGISYDREQGENQGMLEPKVFTYVMIKAGGLWYVTGSGRVPVAAGWGAVKAWLARDGRQVHWVAQANSWTQLWSGAELPAPPPEPIQATVGAPVDTSQA